MKKILMCLFVPVLLASCSGDENKFSTYQSGVPALSAFSIDFGQTAQYEKSTVKPLSVRNIGIGALTFKAALPGDFAFADSSTCNFTVNTLAYGESCTYDIYAETISSGKVTDNLTITTDNPLLAMINVSLKADSAISLTHPVLTFTPDNVTLPDTVKNQQSGVMTITFTNSGTRDLVFSTIVPEPFYSDSSSTCSVKVKNTLLPLAACNLSVYALSPKSGAISKDMAIKANDPDKRNALIKLNANVTE